MKRRQLLSTRPSIARTSTVMARCCINPAPALTSAATAAAWFGDVMGNDEIGGFLTVLVIVALAIGWGGFVASAHYASAARDESCAYRCRLAEGKWPVRAEYVERLSSGHLRCKCQFAEEVTR